MKWFLFYLFALITPFQLFSQPPAPINSGELLAKAEVLYDSGEYKKAFNLYDQIDRNDTNYVRSLYGRARACVGDSLLEKAEMYFRESLASSAQREIEANIMNELGNLLNQRGKQKEAHALFDSAILKYPSFSLFYFNKGIVYVNEDKYKEAQQQFEKALIVNPYLYSAHFYLGIACLNQGKIVPSFMAFIGYLLNNPEGKYWNRCVTLLDAISKGKDDILDYKKKREGDDYAYGEIEDIIFSKVALDKGYKPLLKLDDPISRQIQVFFEKQEFDQSSTDFCMQYYYPFYKQMFSEGRFEPFINRLFYNVDIKPIKSYRKENNKLIDKITKDAAIYFNLIRSSREIQYNKRSAVEKKFLYGEDNELLGFGKSVDNGEKLIGDWKVFYAQGNVKAMGKFNDNGKREGEWIYYYPDGKLKSKQTFKDGKEEGEVLEYYTNGLIASRSICVNGLYEGERATYYYMGAPMTKATYHADKIQGEKQEFYANGSLHTAGTFTEDKRNGSTKTFFKSGKLSETANYKNDLLDGEYKSYNEDGILIAQGLFEKDKKTGEWKTYFADGKPSYVGHYQNGILEGSFVEYYQNGKTSDSINYHKGKLTGIALYYAEDGKLYERVAFENDIAVTATFYDKSGKEISSSQRKDKHLDFTSYDEFGNKDAHKSYNEKGDADGTFTYFYPSGKTKQIEIYKDGILNGTTTQYYRNGRKRYTINFTDGKQNGLYQQFFSNGQLQSEGWMIDDVDEGLWHYYNEAGDLTSTTYYRSGELNGYRTEFWPNHKPALEEHYYNGWLTSLIQYDTTGMVINRDSFPQGKGNYILVNASGKKMAEGHYNFGDFDGVYTTFFFDGSIDTKKTVKSGLMEGTYLSYYYGGAKHAEGKFVAGKREGLWTTYFENGKVYSTESYKYGELNGLSSYFNEDGTKDFVINYKDDTRDGAGIKYDETGGISYITYYKNGFLKGYSHGGAGGKLVDTIKIPSTGGRIIANYSTGNPSRRTIVADEYVNGMDTIFYSNKIIYSVDSNDYGVNEGKRVEYYPNGKIKRINFSICDQTEGVTKIYDEQGQLKSEYAVHNGSMHGPEKIYSAGKLTETRFYYSGQLLSVKREK